MERSLTFYRRVAKDDPSGAPHGLHKLGSDERLFTKPTLLCCGGLLTNRFNRDHPQFANGFAGEGHALIGYKDHIAPGDPIDIVAVAYPELRSAIEMQIMAQAQQLLKGKKEPPAFSALRFVEDHIRPLLVDTDGNTLGIAAIKKNVRNINILAHSYGGEFVRQVGDAFYDELHARKFSESEIRDITSQVLIACYGTVGIIGAGKSSFTTINVLNARDAIGDLSYPRERTLDHMLEDLFRKNKLWDEHAKHPTDAVTLLPVRLATTQGKAEFVRDDESRQCLAYIAQPPFINRAGQAVHDTGSMTHADKNGAFYTEDGTEIAQTTTEDHHQAEHYMRARLRLGNIIEGRLVPNGFMQAKIGAMALVNGLNNSVQNAEKPAGDFIPLPPPMGVLQQPEPPRYPVERDVTNFARTIGYGERIQSAWQRGTGQDR